LSVASRFLADIPSSLAEQQAATPGGRYTRPEQPAVRLGTMIGGGSVTRWSPNQPASVPSRLAAPAFKVGDTVIHTAFGEGVVVKIHLTDDDQEVEVAFPDRGIKRLSVNFAPLTKKG
jgi:ATP-dependent DNA helicase UvrD/PcrA